MLQSVFEDERVPGSVFLDTRIVEVTELLFMSRCYPRLGIPDSTAVSIRFTNGGQTEQVRAHPLLEPSPGRNRGLKHQPRESTKAGGVPLARRDPSCEAWALACCVAARGD